jgi:hypothetical protein
MLQLPKVIASSVIRSAHQGQSHGGVYIVDLETEDCRQVIDWNDQSINWEGRGLDRGLRGIACYGKSLYLAASDEIFAYTSGFSRLTSFKNRYLKHCHEIFISGDSLFITSTGFDSILVYDLRSGIFTQGYCLRLHEAERKLSFGAFDPGSDQGPGPGDTIHINNVWHAQGRMFFASLKLGNLFYIQDGRLFSYAVIPQGTHNARPYRNGVLINDTANNRVSYLAMDGHLIESFPIVQYADDQLLMHDLPRDHARQAFGRGLCVNGHDLIIGGSSPATISVYQHGRSAVLKTVNLTMDVRNAIHGLAIWPF